jgi:hypothetical protein
LTTRPEIELLLCCARVRLDARREERARALLRAELDWDFLFVMSMRHGLMPLIYRHLSGELIKLVPEAHLKKFREHYRHNAARNLFLTGELCRILQRFERRGITAIPYKGPALAVSAYGDIALRQFVDLDILVSPRDVREASALLVEDGYEAHFDIKETQEAAFLRLSYVQLFTRDEGRSAVELHWTIAPRFFSFPLKTEQLQEHLDTITLRGVHVHAPSTEDLILMLCAHGAKDLWARLEWVASIAELCGGKEIDWQRLLTRAHDLSGERMLLLGLFLAHNLLETPLPEEVLRRIEAEPKVARLGDEVRERMFDEGDAAYGVARQISFHLRTKENLRDRIRYCALFAMTTTPVDWALAPLPPTLSFVYYLLRPFRLAKKYMFSPSRRVL